ncbi:MAG: hypothetical protein DMF60_15360 [Acidobacteria bacterium]|nr:MAG: hypothetical protein DMF60_15360 [Acidobacteriota bacterium]
MPALDHLLSQLEESKRHFGEDHGARTERLLALLGKRRFRDVYSLIRFHEALLFIRSHPQSKAAFRSAEELLSMFAQRVDLLRNSLVDLTPMDYIEYSGIAGTVISGAFSYDINRHLVSRYSSRADVDWSYQKHERLGSTLPRFLPLLYEDSLVEANIPYLTWLNAARGGKKRGDLEWLVRRFERLEISARQKAELFDSLEVHIQWDLGNSRASRTLNKRRNRQVFYHTGPLIRRGEVSLDKEFQSPPIELTRLSTKQGQAMQDMLRDATTVRYRELYGITHGDPNNVVRADVGRGVEIFLWGLPPERRLPLRAYHAGFTLKNGVPINYIEGISICERMEIGFNTFYTFREGESAWVYATVLRLLHQIVGVTCISIDPYQIGFHNEEAIDSGAFWFYRKLGFRPTRPELAGLMEAQEKRIATDPKYQTASRVLRRLSVGNMAYGAPDSSPGDWDRFSIRNIGLAVQRRMAREFDGDAEKIRSESIYEAARALRMTPRGLNEPERRAFNDLALVLALIPDLSQWSESEKRKVVQVVRAKAGSDEARYARLLQNHAKLRAAIITLGETR